tara:strand:+ start:488 stop:754 length:267 start_codon:yes stop_codon:yes gene_type:complete
MFNYFFGSDSRSLGYLKFLHENTKNLTVVTTEPIKTGRGKKVKANIIELFVFKIILNLNILIKTITMKICQMHFALVLKIFFRKNSYV